MKRITKVLIATGLVAVGAAALAEPYVDYTPQAGYWEISAVEVDPNHVDDYLTGLRKSQATGFEVLKKRGLIDDYRFLVRDGYVKGSPNVLIMTHSATSANLDPDKARDQAIEKEMLAVFSKEAGDKAVAGYEKYRTFVDDAHWITMDMMK
jgi:hypothetical protein